jgi:hypothetical protein
MKNYRATVKSPALQEASPGFNPKYDCETTEHEAKSIEIIGDKLVFRDSNLKITEEIDLKNFNEPYKIEVQNDDGEWLKLPLIDDNGKKITKF